MLTGYTIPDHIYHLVSCTKQVFRISGRNQLVDVGKHYFNDFDYKFRRIDAVDLS